MSGTGKLSVLTEERHSEVDTTFRIQTTSAGRLPQSQPMSGGGSHGMWYFAGRLTGGQPTTNYNIQLSVVCAHVTG